MPLHRRTHLHGEAAAATLCSVGDSSNDKVAGPAPLITYRYVDRGVERTASFPADSSDDVSGTVKSASSGPLADYQDKLKAIALREKGLEKSEVAQRLCRPERWVQRWWRENPKLLQRPAGANDVVMQRASLESFRDLEIRRSFVREGDLEETRGALLDGVVAGAEWRQAKVLTRNAETGELDLAYDSKGATINAGRQVADYSGGNSCIDKLLQSAFAKMDIRDTKARIFMNYYADGACRTGVHRHDFWTCLISLGADRILTVDNRPLLLRNGDLIVFGTQNHGVPPMPDVSTGRVSLVIFFYPDNDNLERRQWQTITDNGDESENTDMETNSASLEASKTTARGVDHSFNTSILWGDGDRKPVGAPGHGSSEALSDSRDESAQHVPVPGGQHRELFQSPNSGHWQSSLAMLPEQPVTIFTLGVGNLCEKDFFEQLTSASISQLWDIRPPELSRGCRLQHAEPAGLKQCCAARAIVLRTAPLGRREAGGIESHIRSDEGRHTLGKIVAAAQSGGPLAILGAEADWRCDTRSAVADVLVTGRFGPVIVCHVLAAGGKELHESKSPQVCDQNGGNGTRVEKLELQAEQIGTGQHAADASHAKQHEAEVDPPSLREEAPPPRRTNRWNRGCRTGRD